MKIYKFAEVDERQIPNRLVEDFYLAADANDAIERARAEGYKTGFHNGQSAERDGQTSKIIEEARAEEREEIANTISRWWNAKGWDPSCLTILSDFIRSRGEPKPDPVTQWVHGPNCGCPRCHPKPPKIEPIKGLDLEDSDNYVKMVNRINALVDAVNELRAKK
jgi:hypothetical protein